MNGWTFENMDGWMDNWMDGRLDGRMDVSQSYVFYIISLQYFILYMALIEILI